MIIQSIDELDIQEKKLLIRVDFDVPLPVKGKITDDTKLKTVLPTIRYAIENDAKVILAFMFANQERQVENCLQRKVWLQY